MGLAAAVAGVGAVGAGLGWLPPWAAAGAGAWFVGVAALRGAARWREAAFADPTALRRGAAPDRCAWLVEVRPAEAEAARALAAAAAGRARVTFFLPADAAALAETLAAHGHEVAWLGAPAARGGAAAVLPPGPVLVGRANPRVPFWRPLGATPTAGERQMAHTCGLRLVLPTVALPAAPTGLDPVGTDLVRVPAGLPAAQVAAWLDDLDRRAIRVGGLGAYFVENSTGYASSGTPSADWKAR